ncbi:MAG: flagellar motor switch protein FliG [Treponemataceae bacterium]
MKHNEDRINSYKKIANFSAKNFTAEEVEKNNAAVAALKQIEIEEAKEELERRFQNKRLLAENAPQQSQGFLKSSLENLSTKEESVGFTPLNFGKLPAFFSNDYKNNVANKKPSAQPSKEPQKKMSPLASQNTQSATQKNETPFIPQNVDKTTMPTQLDENFFKKTTQIIKNDTVNNFIKTTTTKKDEKDSSYRRVAKFLLLIGNDEAAKILPHLPQDQTDKIIAEIATIDRVGEDEALDILAEFESLVKIARESGGLSTARTILKKAFGDEKAEKVISKTLPFSAERPFDYLQEMDEEHIFLLLKDEPETIRALVLSHLPAEKSATFIKKLDKNEQKEVIHRLAKLQKLDTDMVRRVNESIAQKAEKIETTQIYRFDGKNALAEILRKMSPDMESTMLNHLNQVDPSLEQDLRDRLFTLDDIVDVEDDFVQKRLSLLKDEQIALLIAGKKQDFREKMLKNVSKGRATIILEEETARKPIPRKEVDDVTKQFFSIFQNAWEKKELRLLNQADDEWIN